MKEKQLSIHALETSINEAKKDKTKFFGVKIRMIGMEEPEVIINPSTNFDEKLKYYKTAYNEDLTLKANNSIKIVDFTYGNTFSSIENDLLKI